MKAENWVEKYRPQTLSDVVGNESAIKYIEEWAKSWEDGKPEHKAVILYGKPGIGKTACGHALANDMGWEILELNASDQRTKARIDKNVGNSSKRGTMDGSKRLIILDEADNFYVREDKGGERAVIELIKNTQQPMMLIANEFYDMSYGLRTVCKPIKFEYITPSQIMTVLKAIVEKEGITYDRGVIEKIAYSSDGDLRGAINDLQAVGQGRSHIELEDVSTEERMGKRDNKKNIFKTLKRIFQSANAKEAYEATLEIDESPEDLIQWISENIPNEYTRPEEIDKAYDSVSKAGLFLGRVRIRQNYAMWKYAGALMTAGVFAAKTGKRSTEFKAYKRPTIKSRLWQTKDMRAIRDSLAKKIGDRCHTPMGSARTDLFPFFRLMMKNASYATYITASLGLSIEELAFIKDSKPEVKEISEIYKKAQSIIMEDAGYLIESSSEISKRVEEEKSLSKYGKAQTTIDNAWGI